MRSRGHPRPGLVRQARRDLARAVAPYAAGTALDEYWALLLANKPADAKKVIADLGAKGVPVP